MKAFTLIGAFTLLILPVASQDALPIISPADQAEMNQLVAKEEALEAELAKTRKAKLELAKKIGSPETPNTTQSSSISIAPKIAEAGIQFRRSVTDEKLAGLPATFQLTAPSGEDPSYVIDAGIVLNRDLPFEFLGAPTSWRLLSEYHYNSTTGSLNDTFLFGTGVETVYGTPDFGVWSVFDLNYKRDNLSMGESILGNLLFYPSISDLKVGSIFFESEYLNGRFRPYFGVDFESADGIPDSGNSGSRVSPRAGAILSLGILPEYFGNRLDFTNQVGFWSNSSRSGIYDSYDSEFFHYLSAINYWFNTDLDGDGLLSDEEKAVGVTLRYEYGDNPNEGSFEKDVITLGLSVKF